MNILTGELNELRNRLDQLITEDADYREIYEVSQALDKLIVLYYGRVKA